MRTFLAIAFLLCAGQAFATDMGDAMRSQVGTILTGRGNAPFCFTEEKAKAIARAHLDSGIEAAKALFQVEDACQLIPPGQPFTIVEVILAEENDRTSYVVTKVQAGIRAIYWLAYSEKQDTTI